jgi:hypothetical protein
MTALAHNPSRRRARDHECECGYQIAIEHPHPTCPMCGKHVWFLIANGRQTLLAAGR